LVLVLTRGGAVFGDLVRCPDPDDNARYVVGRISGLSGDSIELLSRTLRVNGTRYDSTDACTKPTVSVPNPETGTPVEMQCARVDMGGGWHYRVTALKHNPSNNHKKEVGPGKVYLLSDNRDMHEDSRDFGTIDEANCQQRVFFRLWGANGWTDAEHRLNFIR
jgi:signal peptidase I